MRIRVPVAILLAVSALVAACAETPPGTSSAPVAGPASTPSEAPQSAAAATPQQPVAIPSPGISTSGQSVDLGSGLPAPPLELTLLDGGSLRLAELRGKVVVLNFWASWCIPCRKEMPSFEAIWQEYQDQDVVFVGVAVNSDREKNARAFAEEVGVTYPLGVSIPPGSTRATTVS